MNGMRGCSLSVTDFKFWDRIYWAIVPIERARKDHDVPIIPFCVVVFLQG